MSSNDAQPSEPTQTMNTINNENVTKQSSPTTFADNDKSSEIQQTTTSKPPISQIPDSDVNKQATSETQQTTTSKPSTSQIPDPDVNKHATSETQQTTTPEPSTSQIPDSDINKQGTYETQQTTTTEPSSSQTPNSDVNKQATFETQQTTTSEPSTSQIPDSDVNKEATTDTQQTTTSEPSTSQILDSDVNKQATFEPSTSQIPDSGVSKQATSETQQTATSEPSISQIPNSDVNKQATQATTETQQTTASQSSTAQILESDVNKQATSETKQTSTSEPSTSQIPNSDTSKQEPVLVDDQSITSENEADKDTNLKSKTESDDNPTTTPNQDRKHLLTLIKEELTFVEKTCPKLGKDEERITKETKKALEEHHKLQEDHCDLKELKDLKRSVTKLKLQIPAKYRTYDDENDQQKHQKLFLDNKGLFSAKILKKLPRLHNELFHESLFSKTIQQRYNELELELKLCLLCFSVFPENEEISRRLMVYWWIAEGFILEEYDIDKTVEDRANEFFIELMDKEFIEVVSRTTSDRYVSTCKMQPMIRAALVKIADKLKFFDFDQYGNPKDSGKFDEIDSPEEMQDVYPLGDPREFFDFYNEKREQIKEKEPISFFDSKMNPIPFAVYQEKKDNNQLVVDRNGKQIDVLKPHYLYRKKNVTTKSYKACLMGSGLPKGLNWEKLHMLFNVNDDILEFKLEWFLRMKNVNLLFLGKWQSSAAHHIEVEEFNFKESLEHMKHVRFFSLQGVSRVIEIPESISKLESLLILDLRACHNLEVIPKTIGSLKHLTHLDMSECYLLKDIPKEISSLESLQVLKGFVVVDSPEKHMCTLQDLKKLENLRKLSMYTHMQDFPRESHLDALQKLEALRKLTILWGGHESKPQKDQTDTNQNNNADNNKKKLEKRGQRSKLSKIFGKTTRVEGSMRRMNAFNDSTLGSRLEKLDLKCFPNKATPEWLTPGSLKRLKKLYIRGGQFSDLGQYQDIYESFDENSLNNIPKLETWNVKVLRLKYLTELKMEFTELRNLFPEMTYLEKVKCPRLTMFPCNERGVWIQKPSTSTS